MSDEVRFLARNSMHEDRALGTGYTADPSKAMHDEPEAVSLQDQEWITYRARRSARETQRLHWSERRANLEREVEWLRGQRFERDISRPLRVLRRQLDHIDKLIVRG